MPGQTIVVDAEKNAELRHHANAVFAKRDDRLKSMTDESVPVYYTIMCQAFSQPCVLRDSGAAGPVVQCPGWMPRPPMSWTPTGPARWFPKDHCIDENLGRYEDVDEAVNKYSHGALEHVTPYSLFQDPHDPCGCFSVSAAWSRSPWAWSSPAVSTPV